MQGVSLRKNIFLKNSEEEPTLTQPSLGGGEGNQKKAGVLEEKEEREEVADFGLKLIYGLDRRYS